MDCDEAYCKCSKDLLSKFNLKNNYVYIATLQKIFNTDVSKYGNITYNDVFQLERSLRCLEYHCATLIYCGNKYLRTKKGSKHKGGCDYDPKKSNHRVLFNDVPLYFSKDKIPKSKIISKKEKL